MTKLVPIVALVPEDTLSALDLAVQSYGPPSPALESVMDKNGWTVEAIIAGTFISFCLRDAGVVPR